MPYKIECYLNENHPKGTHYLFKNKRGWWECAMEGNQTWGQCTDDWGEELAKLGRPIPWLELLVVLGLTKTQAERMK